MRSELPAPGEKLAARIAAAIEDDIVAGGWAVGSSIGSEADLIARYGASRGVVREAVRIVEHHEAARMRRGPSGGLIVRAPDSGPAIRALVVNLVHARTSLTDLLAARLALEPLACELAAGCAGPEGSDLLAAALAHERTLSAAARILDDGPTVHDAIAAASGNAVLELFVRVLTTLSKRQARALGSPHPDPAVATEVARAHERIAAAYAGAAAGRDGAALRSAMDEHLRALHDPAAPASARHPGLEPFSPPAGAKVAESVATAMLDDIVAKGWPVGQIVGSEADLLTRYGVSRAAIREAVRILEHHGAARMRRGPGGGLLVTAPDPTASITATALYLNFRGVREEDVRVARLAVEWACIDVVAARAAGDPTVAAALLATQDVEAPTAGGSSRSGGGRPAKANAFVLAGDFHHRLAELADNPILLLFTHILTAEWAHHFPLEDGAPALADSRGEATLLSAHVGIAEAVGRGDAHAAKQLLARHLEGSALYWH